MTIRIENRTPLTVAAIAGCLSASADAAIRVELPIFAPEGGLRKVSALRNKIATPSPDLRVDDAVHYSKLLFELPEDPEHRLHRPALRGRFSLVNAERSTWHMAALGSSPRQRLVSRPLHQTARYPPTRQVEVLPTEQARGPANSCGPLEHPAPAMVSRRTLVVTDARNRLPSVGP